MLFFIFIDRFLIHNIFEPISHWFQRYFGWDCFSLANVFRLLTSLTFLYSSIYEFREGNYLYGSSDFILSFLYFYITRNGIKGISSEVRSKSFRNSLERSELYILLRSSVLSFSLIIAPSLFRSLYLLDLGLFSDWSRFYFILRLVRHVRQQKEKFKNGSRILYHHYPENHAHNSHKCGFFI